MTRHGKQRVRSRLRHAIVTAFTPAKALRPALPRRSRARSTHRRRARPAGRAAPSWRSGPAAARSPTGSCERARRVIAIELDRDLAAHLRVRYALQPERRDRRSGRARRATRRARRDEPTCSRATCRTTSRRRSSFTRSKPPRADARRVSRAARGRRAHGRAAGQQDVRRAQREPAGVRARGVHAATCRAGAFTPPPKVDSAIVRVTPRDRVASCRRTRERAFRDVGASARSACGASSCVASCARSRRSTPSSRSACCDACGIDPECASRDAVAEDFARLLARAQATAALSARTPASALRGS